MNIILIQYKGDRYACYPSAGVKRRIGSPTQEKNIKSITGKAGGKVIEWSRWQGRGRPGRVRRHHRMNWWQAVLVMLLVTGAATGAWLVMWSIARWLEQRDDD